MMLKAIGVVSHVLHVLVIAFTVSAWAFPATRDLHLLLCGLILASWFIVGPLLGKPGFCVLTGVQHWVWRKTGMPRRENYMSYLFQQLTRREPTRRGVMAIDVGTQLAVYVTALLSMLLRA